MLDCAAVRELAPELALGLVSGPERAAAIAHLDKCAGCRSFVEDLAGTTDALLVLAPEAEPPAGFETRVLDRLGLPVAPAAGRRWPGRRETVAWLLAAACLIALAAIALRDSDDGGVRLDRDLQMAVMATPDGTEVGTVYLHAADERDVGWVYLSLPGWDGWQGENGEPAGWSIRLELVDGERELIEIPALRAGRQTWGVDLPPGVDEVVGVAVVGPDGHAWCSADLT